MALDENTIHILKQFDSQIKAIENITRQLSELIQQHNKEVHSLLLVPQTKKYTGQCPA